MPDGIKVLLSRIALIVGAALFYYFGFDYRYGALLVFWIIVTWLILRSYDDWETFLKRCVLAVPFISLVELGLYVFLRPDLFTYWYSGVLLFFALLINVPKVLLWSHYFTISLIITALVSLDYKKLYSFIFVTFFFASYLLIMNRKQEKHIPILIKSSISAMLITLFLWIFMVSNSFMSRHNVTLGIDIGFYCFLGLCFFLVFYILGKKHFKANDLFKKGNIFSGFHE